MFTGIVEEIGKVAGITKTRVGASLKIKTKSIGADAKLGDSVAINGVCLSVVEIKGDILSFDVIRETLSNTSLGDLKINDPLNLERSLKPDSRMGGHFVTGHIDYKGKIESMIKGSEGIGVKIYLPEEFSNFVVKKGSVALDGISLTVAEVERKNFTVYLIPHTLKVTTLGNKKKGDFLNIETDLLAKYIAKHIQKPTLESLLKKYQYV